QRVVAGLLVRAELFVAHDAAVFTVGPERPLGPVVHVFVPRAVARRGEVVVRGVLRVDGHGDGSRLGAFVVGRLLGAVGTRLFFGSAVIAAAGGERKRSRRQHREQCRAPALGRQGVTPQL